MYILNYLILINIIKDEKKHKTFTNRDYVPWPNP